MIEWLELTRYIPRIWGILEAIAKARAKTSEEGRKFSDAEKAALKAQWDLTWLMIVADVEDGKIDGR